MAGVTILVASMMLLWPGLASSSPATPTPAQPARSAIALPASGLDAGTLEPSLRDLLPELVAAALESGGGHDVVADRSSAAWELKLTVTGRGPWRLSARLEGLAQAGRSERFSTRKQQFSDRDGLTGAVDELAAEIHQKMSPEGKGAPIALARSLSASVKAVDSYVSAVSAMRTIRSMRAGDASSASSQLDTALAADPSFCEAAVERAFFDLTSGRRTDAMAALSMLQAAHATAPCRTARAAESLRGFELVAGGDTGAALELAGRMLQERPLGAQGRRIHGMALGMSGRLADSGEDWKALALAGQEDPRIQMWLGSALMAAGDFNGAAAALGRVTAVWPDLLRAWMLRAESQVRGGETAAARQTLDGMKAFMTSRKLGTDTDERNPELMLGSVDLLEGHTVAGLKRFEGALDALEKAGMQADVLDTLHNAIIEMRRDLIISGDPVVRRRQIEDAREAIDRYQSSQTPEHRLAMPWELARLRGLVSVRQGNTADAWKSVDDIKSRAGEPGYSEYYEAYLSAVILFKEGDEEGSTAQFGRAAKARDRIVNLIDLAQMQGNIRKYDESHATFEEIARRLERYDPMAKPDVKPPEELILLDPHLAAMIPIYHYTWARLAYETDKPAESRLHFDHMLKYLRDPDDDLVPLVKEAYGRGASPQ